MSAFDVRGPLPTGVTVLEASAGTGKTYTIAALAARYVAEGTPLEELLLVTFTRMATGELRERVRDRLVAVERGLETGVSDDEIVQLLSGRDVELRRRRLARALADFDAATIATTHGFCQEVLGGLGIAGDSGRDVAFVEDLGDLLEEVVDDLYVRRFHREGAPAFDRAEALAIARAAVANPAAPVEPRQALPDGVPAMRRRLAEAVREELEARKRRAGVMTYDDLLTRLDEALKGTGGPDVATRLQARYKVVLVDEFQDTDPVQWDIMRRAFGGGFSTLVLIGDPKQAIYAFRGADVYAYLAAKHAAGKVATLQVNWRSDQGLLSAYDALFRGARLGHEDIAYLPMRAAEANIAPRLKGAGAPLRVRVVAREGLERTPQGYARNAAAREHIARDVANELVALLESGARVERRGASPGSGPVRPGHVAVLVRTHRNAALVREALDAAGIPAVINGAGSVFGTRPAIEWLRLLEALERPTDPRRAHAAALTCFFGWDAARVASAGDAEWEEVHRRLHDWARVLRLRGVASLAETISLVEGLPARVLALTGGERRLTDVRHVAQLLHAAATAEHLGTTALTGWLRRRIAAAEEETGDEERSRRLESDAEAVQLLTIHRSKGLEFPIVYYPFLWEPGFIPQRVPVAYHDPEAGDRRTVDVGLEGASFRVHAEQHRIEQRGEDLRLAYVALTRAQHQAVVWWAGSRDSRDSALGRLLFARDAEGNVAPAGRSTPSDEVAIARFEELASAAPGCISVEPSAGGEPVRWQPERMPAAALRAADFARELDAGWRRTSYSDLTALAHEARVASEPEVDVVTDEPGAGEDGEDAAAVGGLPLATAALPPAMAAPSSEPDGGVSTATLFDAATAATLFDAGAPPATASASPPAGVLAARPLLAAMPAGVDVGTFVHRVLEAVDFSAPDLDAELARGIGAVRARRPFEIGDTGVVVAGLRAAIETPLGEAFGGLRLRDVARADRLDELTFELPLAGGDEPAGRFSPAALGAVLREHLAPGDALHGYAARLADPDLRHGVRGYLTGSLDLVIRRGDEFLVVDYKTNWLAPPGEELSAWHYRPAAVAAEMERAHYGLQALLYLAALHRYLRWRLRDYDPDRNLAGAAYLFLRGMTGPDTPGAGGSPHGVFGFRPRGELVEAISDLLDTGGDA
ncbi:UvrD-helicase domain-containing protein [Candidatus Solirubrobacter pratensis]|uniref:UvrD-helicase domain-containing protein n=1 Tax=Candidatus Solirubrobacter pratensis TaxID=1298857 RepID=UPI0004002C78|nr:UvrD-helicase domain-containing protein [Candidatus Solirubrobacter pratensis]